MNKKGELMMRKAICENFIKSLECIEDPRQPDALSHYKSQLEELERKIKECSPPPVVVGLKTARMTGKVPK